MMDSSSSRTSKAPAKLQDCIIGIDIDNAIENYENPLAHQQCDGHTNNITFKTDCVDTWKNVVLSYFGEGKAQVIKENQSLTVIKVSFSDDSKQNLTVKINIFSSGSVVIQGAKCTVFKSRYFQSLKERVHMETQPQLSEDTPVKQIATSEDVTLNVSFDPEITIIKKDNIKMTDPPVTSTPTLTKRKILSSPKERVTQYQESLQTKLTNIDTILETLNSTLLTVVDLVANMKTTVEFISSGLNEKSEKCNKAIKDVTDKVKALEAKVNHTNGLADSLHTKTNILDNQIKTIDQNQGKISEKLDKIQQVIENDESNILVHTSIKNGKCDENNKTGFNLIEDQFTHKIVGGKPKPISTQQLTTSDITLDSDKAVDHVHKDVNNDEIIDIHDTIKCGTLILSDSILQRIVPKRFSPKEKTIK